jgi:hypothetical protein
MTPEIKNHADPPPFFLKEAAILSEGPIARIFDVTPIFRFIRDVLLTDFSINASPMIDPSRRE